MQLITPEEYFHKIKSLRTPEEIQQVCESLTTVLFNANDKPKTRVNKLTPYNKLVREIPDDDLIEGENAYIQQKQDGTLWKRHLHFRYTGLETTNFNGEGGINASNSKINRLENKQKIDVSAYLEVTVRLLQSNDPHELAVGLIAASGRRPIEILARGHFSRVTKLPKFLKSGYFVQFHGQAKKRDYDMSKAERPAYRIGVLIPSEIFLEAFKRFDVMPESEEIHKFLDEETEKRIAPEEINKKIESKRGNSLRRVIEKEFSFLPPRLGKEKVNNLTLRAAYLRLITERDCPKNVDNLLWAARAVGHFIDTNKPDDSELKHLITTLGYSDYYIDESVPFIDFQKFVQENEITPVETKEPVRNETKPVENETIPVKTKEPVENETIPVEINKGHVSRWRIYDSDIEKLKSIQELHNCNQQDAIKYLFEQADKVLELEKEIAELKSELVNAEESEVSMSQINVDTTDDILEEKIEKVLKRLLPQLQSKSLNTEISGEKNKSDRNWSSVSSEELRSTKARGAKDEKIYRSWLAIEAYNNSKSEKNQKWYAGLRTLSELSGCNGQDISPWISEHKIMIDAHNTKHELGVHHNKIHKNVNIKDVIKW